MNTIPSKFFLLGAFVLVSHPTFVLAHKENGNAPVPKKLVVNAELKPSNDELVDIASALGKVHFASKKNKSALEAKIVIPASAPSLGIIDDASAEVSQIHLEILHEDAAIGDCILEVKPHRRSSKQKDAEQDIRKLVLHVKSHGRSDVKGSCGGSVPAVQSGDVFKVYAMVNGVRVDFLSSVEEDEPPFVPPPR